jgi:hypothetical protein
MSNVQRCSVACIRFLGKIHMVTADTYIQGYLGFTSTICQL